MFRAHVVMISQTFLGRTDTDNYQATNNYR
jgi:hypothetical protein